MARNKSVLASGESPLKYSFGVGQMAPETYISSSRSAIPLLHMGMGVCTKVSKTEEKVYSEMMKPDDLNGKIKKHEKELKELKYKLSIINNDLSDRKRAGRRHQNVKNNQQKLGDIIKEREYFLKRLQWLYLDSVIATKGVHPPYLENFDIWNMRHSEMIRNKIYTCAYYDNFEGRQALLYRKKWSLINKCVSNTNYFHWMKPFMDALNEYHKLCGKAKHLLSEEETEKAMKVCKNMVAAWNILREKILCLSAPAKEKETKKKKGKKEKNEMKLLNMDHNELTLGAKGHYYPHGVEYMKLWKVSLGYLDEESVEKFHKVCTAVFLRYQSQRGLLGIKYSLDHLLLVTSPDYANYVIYCIFFCIFVCFQ